MELGIKKDPQDLNKSIFSGRKAWQWLCIILAGIIAVVFTLVVGKHLDATINGVIIAVLVVPLGYIGVFQKNGLDFFEYYKEKHRNMTNQNVFYFDTGEPNLRESQYFQPKITKKTKNNMKGGSAKK